MDINKNPDMFCISLLVHNFLFACNVYKLQHVCFPKTKKFYLILFLYSSSLSNPPPSFLSLTLCLSQLFLTAGKKRAGGGGKSIFLERKKKMPAWLGLLMKLSMTKCIAFNFVKLLNTIKLYDTLWGLLSCQ